MRLVPPTVAPSTTSAAEGKIFGLLRHVQAGDHALCLHSLRLSHHVYKELGELDFVVITARGILVIEVKGGTVSRDSQGIWFYGDRYGDQHRSSEGPIRQAESGMYSLRDRLRAELGDETVRAIPIGCAVIFPDCSFDVSSIEWDDELILDKGGAGSSDSLQRFIDTALRIWQEKRKQGYRLPVAQATLDRVSRYLRPNFDMVPTLGDRAGELDARMTSLTDEQYDRLDAVEENPRILCSGGAGSGKTFLAAEVSRRHADAGERVLFVCRSEVLAGYLGSRIDRPGVRVCSYQSLREDESSSSAPYDVLVVDEAQDLMSFDCLDRLGGLIRGGLEGGVWRVFIDANNQAGLYPGFDDDALEFLHSCGAVRLKLTRNCRNTSEIVLQTRLSTRADLGVATAGNGPPVTHEFFSTITESAVLLAAHLRSLLANGVEPQNITVLSPRRYEDATASRLPKDLTDGLYVVDPGNSGRLPLPGMTFSTIRGFKGLENRFVAITDLESIDGPVGREQLYVAMSRAQAGLWICLDSSLRNKLSLIQEGNFDAVVAGLPGGEG